ncbi:MAG: hypothetical protein ACLS6O_00185 [Bifidobacterium sp.]
MRESFPAKTMSDGELLTQSRVYRDEYQYWRERDGGPVVQGMTGRVMRSGLLKPGLEQKPLLHLNDGRRAPDWDEFTDQAAISSSRANPSADAGAPPAGTTSAGHRPRRRDTDTGSDGRDDKTGLAERVGGEQARTHLYIAREGRTRLAEDDRRTPPRHRHRRQGPDRLGHRHVHERKNQKQKNEGRAVNLRFRPGTPVELFTGRGTERRTMQVDPQTLVQAIIDAQKRNRDAEESLDTASVELASKTVEESWPQIERMQGRFAEYQRAGTYKPAVALKWARRLVDRTAGADEGRWTSRQRRQAAGSHPGTRRRTGTDAGQSKTPTANRRTGRGGDRHAGNGRPRRRNRDGPRRSRLAGRRPGAKAEPPETTRRDDPERRHTDLKSTLDRFHTRLRRTSTDSTQPRRHPASTGTRPTENTIRKGEPWRENAYTQSGQHRPNTSRSTCSAFSRRSKGRPTG